VADAGGQLVDAVRLNARRRLRAEAAALALRLGSVAVLLAALAATLVMMDLVSSSSVWLRAALVVLVLLLPVVTLARLLRHVQAPVEAKRLDDTLGLKDRVSSALAFLALDERTAFHDAALADAQTCLPRIIEKRDTGVGFRRPALTLFVVLAAAAALLAAAYALGPDADDLKTGAIARRDTEPSPQRPTRGDGDPNTQTEPDTSVDDLEEVDATKLTEDVATSAYTDAELKQLEAMAASETSEADRLLAQAAYLDETDLSKSEADQGRTDADGDRVMMKEPDMDMIREMVKEAQKRKKEGKSDDGSGDDIKLEVLVKTHGSSSGKRPKRRPGGRRPSGGAGGPSQDTRIKPKRVRVAELAAFKITSVRSLTPTSAAAAKRIVLSEAIMRTSGVPQPALVEARTVALPGVEERSAPVFLQNVPAEFRAIVSKYFEGLKQAAKQESP